MKFQFIKEMQNLTKIWLVIFFILLIAIFSYIQITKPTPKLSLNIVTGPVQSDSYSYALSYQSLLEKEGVILNITPTNGSLDTLGYLHNKKADIGFVHSGILYNNREYNLESLASVYYEPLWIFYKNNGYEVNYIFEATGKNVGISITNDGTYEIARKLSKLNGLINNVNSTYIQDHEALSKLKENEIDFFITLASENNPIISELLNDPSIELMNIKRIDAYTQKFEYLKALKLYEGSIDLYRNIPSKNINILSTTQNIVCNPDLPGELIRIFLKKVNEIHSAKTFFQSTNQFINMDSIDTVINEDAQLYILNGESWLEKIFPYWIASNIDRLKLFLIPLIWLIIPLLKSIVPLYVFTTRAKIFRWYSRLDKINNAIINRSKDYNDLKEELSDLRLEINNKTNVPLSYKSEFYNLIMHIESLENKIKNS
jgi:TRAP-type uncharacterized transport system substrate-binding protein